MIFVTGPAGAGKTDYVISLGYSEEDISRAEITDSPVVADVQDIAMNTDCDIQELVRLLQEKEVVICDEVGSGIIPVEKDMRKARETVGRTAIELAKRADRVVRVICGIPQIIKEK